MLIVFANCASIQPGMASYLACISSIGYQHVFAFRALLSTACSGFPSKTLVFLPSWKTSAPQRGHTVAKKKELLPASITFSNFISTSKESHPHCHKCRGGRSPLVWGYLCLSPGWNMVRQIGPISLQASISSRRLLILSCKSSSQQHQKLNKHICTSKCWQDAKTARLHDLNSYTPYAACDG